jgi:hypothetical protein
LENKDLKARPILALTIALFLMLGLFPLSQAAAPYTAIGTAVVDGYSDEWDLEDDYFADMYRAGFDTMKVESKVYMRYDPATEIMYVLVLTEPGIPAIIELDDPEYPVGPDDAWLAINHISNKMVSGTSINDAVQPNFAWVGQNYDGDNTHALGYEASFILARGEYEVIIHIQVYDDYESQTSRTLRAGLDLFVVPEYALGSLIALGACFAGFAVFKKRSNLPYFKRP